MWAWKEKREHDERLEHVGYRIGARVHALVKRLDKQFADQKES
jgi:hypothetical protein